MFAQEHAELIEFCKKCRPDMHEPDEQDVKVAIVGDHLDNATGNHVDVKAIAEGYQEYVIILRRFDEEDLKFYECRVNLANLIAFARMAEHARVQAVV
jgi:hypothetical protein